MAPKSVCSLGSMPTVPAGMSTLRTGQKWVGACSSPSSQRDSVLSLLSAFCRFLSSQEGLASLAVALHRWINPSNLQPLSKSPAHVISKAISISAGNSFWVQDFVLLCKLAWVSDWDLHTIILKTNKQTNKPPKHGPHHTDTSAWPPSILLLVTREVS